MFLSRSEYGALDPSCALQLVLQGGQADEAAVTPLHADRSVSSFSPEGRIFQSESS